MSTCGLILLVCLVFVLEIDVHIQELLSHVSIVYTPQNMVAWSPALLTAPCSVCKTVPSVVVVLWLHWVIWFIPNGMQPCVIHTVIVLRIDWVMRSVRSYLRKQKIHCYKIYFPNDAMFQISHEFIHREIWVILCIAVALHPKDTYMLCP